MADSPVNGFANGFPVLATDILYLARSPFAVGDDRKITALQLKSFVIPSGALDPNVTVTGLLRQLYVQEAFGFTALWMNTDGVTAWQVLYGTGVSNPNGLVSGLKGATWIQIPGDGTAQQWLNVDGGTTWV